jgi:hypothetical protein
MVGVFYGKCYVDVADRVTIRMVEPVETKEEDGTVNRPKDTEGIKALIDKMSYRNMLWKQRFAPASEMFSGETGDYFKKVMAEKKDALGADKAARVSEEVGW